MRAFEPARVLLHGIHLVEASAGTGKTHAITSLYLRAVIEQGLLPDRILVVTFTRAATTELRERIRSRLRSAHRCLLDVQSARSLGDELVVGDSCLVDTASSPTQCELALERLSAALLVVDEASVMTIHGFCGRVLESNAFESRMDLSTELLESTDDLREELTNDFALGHLSTLPSRWLRCVEERGLDLSSLRELTRLSLAHPDARIEPAKPDAVPALEPLAQALESTLVALRDALRSPKTLAAIGRLQKTKSQGAMGPRLLGYVHKLADFANLPVERMDGPCDANEKLRELAEKNPASVSAELEEFFEKLRLVEASYDAFDAGVRALVLWLKHELLEELPVDFERRKQLRHVLGYDDLLRRLCEALRGDQGESLATCLRQKYPLALIDEFQDTDPIQYEVFSRVYARDACLFMIGDPKQSIYAFRGADINNYLGAARSAGERRHTLEVNYRSDPGMIDAIDELLGGHADPFGGAGIQFVRVSPRPSAVDMLATAEFMSGLEIVWCDPRAEEQRSDGLAKYALRGSVVAATVHQVRRILESGLMIQERPVQASDIAVLTRTNRECAQIAAHLRQKGIRCIETSDGSVLTSGAAGSLRTLLRALLSPRDLRALMTLLLDPIVGMTPADVVQVQSNDTRIENWSVRLSRWSVLWAREGVLSMLLRAIEEMDVPRQLLASATGERWLTDLQHVAELLQSVALSERLGQQSQLIWLSQAAAGGLDCALEDRQLRVESDADAVIATTIHRSKGLQYPFVICPFLWDGASPRRTLDAIVYRAPIPDPRTESRVEGGVGDAHRRELILHVEPSRLDPEGSELRALRAEQMAESARVLYVAVTRAKHYVTLLLGPAKGLRETALGHVLFSRTHAACNTELSGQGASAGALRGELFRMQEAFRHRSIRIREYASDEPGVVGNVEASTAHAELFAPPLLRRVVRTTVQTTSYSAITANATRNHLGQAEAAAFELELGHGPVPYRDVDAEAASVAAGAATSRGVEIDRHGPIELEALSSDGLPGAGFFDGIDAAQSRAASVDPESLQRLLLDAGFEGLPLGGLPGGAKTGEAIHALFETMDFRTFPDATSESKVREVFERFGIVAKVDHSQLVKAFDAIVDASLLKSGPTLTLRAIEREKCRAELEFTFDLGELNPRTLRELLVPGVTGMSEAYSESLKSLEFGELSGFLRGFIDLVFEVDGRIYVVDYKSNSLGPSLEHYRGPWLEKAMADHHYPVQAALYAAAVDGWLSHCWSGYSYEKHFGGVLYLFVRGMHRALPPGHGVFFHRPLKEALRKLTEGLRGRGQGVQRLPRVGTGNSEVAT